MPLLYVHNPLTHLNVSISSNFPCNFEPESYSPQPIDSILLFVLIYVNIFMEMRDMVLRAEKSGKRSVGIVTRSKANAETFN